MRDNRLTFVSTCRVEADQKKFIIGKLKAEVETLRQNSSQFQMLREQYTDLDRKYKAQQEEKNLQDADFKNRHDGALRYIGQLRNETEAIKAQLRDKKLEVEDLQTDQEGLRSSLEQKNIDIEKFRTDVSSLVCDSDQLQGERRSLTAQAEALRKNNSHLSEELFGLQKENQSCEGRLGDLEKYNQQLQAESHILKEKIKCYEDTNNSLDAEIQSTMEEVADMEATICEHSQAVSDLQNANASIVSNMEQFKSESIHNQRAAQSEIIKNNDLLKKLKQAEAALRVRKAQVQEGCSQMQTLAAENSNLEKVNNEYTDDLQACRKHLENLRLLNHQLINSLQGFSEEDKKASQLISRQQRVKYLGARVQETSSIEFHASKETARTDVSVTLSRKLYHY